MTTAVRSDSSLPQTCKNGINGSQKVFTAHRWCSCGCSCLWVCMYVCVTLNKPLSMLVALVKTIHVRFAWCVLSVRVEAAATVSTDGSCLSRMSHSTHFIVCSWPCQNEFSSASGSVLHICTSVKELQNICIFTVFKPKFYSYAIKMGHTRPSPTVTLIISLALTKRCVGGVSWNLCATAP